MKNRKIAIGIGTVTVLAAVTLLSACGSGQAKSNSSNTTNKNFTVATDRWADWGTDFEKFPNQLAKKAGIKVNWDVYVDANWADKKATILSSGNLPDVFMGSNTFTDQQIAQNQNDFIDLSKYINEKDMPNLMKMLKDNPEMKATITSPDGKIYSLPKIAPMRPTIANQLFINQKWLTQLGLKMPTTYDEFVNVLEQFKEKIPGSIPYATGNWDPVFSYILPFNNRLGAAGTNGMELYDGKVAWAYDTEEYKAGIEAMHEAYTKGLIDPEMFTETTTQAQNKMMATTEKVGVAAGWTADANFGANAKDYVALPALKGPDGKQYVMSDPDHFNQSRNEVLVTTHAKNVKALMKWLDSFYTEDASIQNYYGEFGVGTEKTADGYTVLKPTGENSADTQAWINSLRDFGPKVWSEADNSKVTYQDQNNGDALKLKMDATLKQYALPAFPNVQYTSKELNTIAQVYQQLSAYATQMQAQWVTKGGVDKDWSTYESKLKAMGLDKFMKIQNDAYKRYEKQVNK